MASQSKNFISFVALGGQNPQILNIDFLKTNNIVPIDKEPFLSLLAQEKPAKKFISVPGFANLELGNIEFIVDESRFQIREKGISDWVKTEILDIARRYYEILPYTPLKVVGINLNAIITFDAMKEAVNFQQLFLSTDNSLLKIISENDVNASVVLRYPYSNKSERITLTIGQPDKDNGKRDINFNYEFDFVDWPNFKDELSRISEISRYFDSILDKLLRAI